MNFYQKLHSRIKHYAKPLTLSEKILYGHLKNPTDLPVRGSSWLKLVPDRVAMQDASAQTAILQFMLSQKPNTAVPASVHCDHLIQAHVGAEKDLQKSISQNSEIYDFLESSSIKFGMDFWRPGAGIIHQIVLENYAQPGMLMLGTDSHTPNAGGLGMLAIGVGGADAVDAMAGIPWELKAPKILGVHLDGKLQGWATPKDVILHLAGKLTCQGGTNHIIEYFGPGVQTLSCTGMATICNMGAELGATTSVFPFTASMDRYLQATRRVDAAKQASAAKDFLRADTGSEFDQVVHINLSELEPHINGPFSPDASWPISQFKTAIKENGWKDSVTASLIGSCTNSSYQDMSNVAFIAKQAQEKGIKTKSPFFVTPGSEQIRATIERDGITSTLESIGGQVLANACGPCIGQWKRIDHDPTVENSILTSFNRNFKGRNDGSVKTMNFLASPEIVTAIGLSGKLSFNPATDDLLDSKGTPFKLLPPSSADLPSQGFEKGREEFLVSKCKPDASVQIKIDPLSTRLQALEPFLAWDGQEFTNLNILVKAVGKCTTDHISAAGPWLKYKGHLENLAKNTLMGATNAHTNKMNSTWNPTTSQYDTIPNTAFAMKKAGVLWAVIADWNYGEGSAREHASLQPRFLGCKTVIARSFARIHETNLKKQGVLPMVFKDPQDYEKIGEKAVLTTRGVVDLGPGSIVTLVATQDGTDVEIPLVHTMSLDQIEWFKAGSALNKARLE